MTGYYESISDGSIYHVYNKGFDMIAVCKKAENKPINKPFPISDKNINQYLRHNCWVKIEKPELPE